MALVAAMTVWVKQHPQKEPQKASDSRGGDEEEKTDQHSSAVKRGSSLDVRGKDGSRPKPIDLVWSVGDDHTPALMVRAEDVLGALTIGPEFRCPTLRLIRACIKES